MMKAAQQGGGGGAGGQHGNILAGGTTLPGGPSPQPGQPGGLMQGGNFNHFYQVHCKESSILCLFVHEKKFDETDKQYFEYIINVNNIIINSARRKIYYIYRFC